MLPILMRILGPALKHFFRKNSETDRFHGRKPNNTNRLAVSRSSETIVKQG